ncbi:hypothetical protein H6P81_003665 [Aristolochia fimbriata]|uniref:Uncharacterized protein n=1 Tax=Aristolochia fimbriata TaxID=158543 RepID=A0AAV7FD86_ARIFI|nr:hypothetical protein H6P81_003665 [Aristolochia fimbriata]
MATMKTISLLILPLMFLLLTAEIQSAGVDDFICGVQLPIPEGCVLSDCDARCRQAAANLGMPYNEGAAQCSDPNTCSCSFC